jgi:hypothetical protein
MEFGIVRVLGFGLFTVVDVGVAIYYRHVGVETHVSTILSVHATFDMLIFNLLKMIISQLEYSYLEYIWEK